ncbi:MAG: aminoacyl-tRNA hydrolase [Candidatus Omnitrophica bacterium]|nr:aminoacyl-tRNA hydrolase [Candidatus Omnitrophota bacterium]
MNIIVGLGNPGQKYEKTRHNVGFRVISLLFEKNQVNSRINRELYQAWLVTLNKTVSLLVKPLTFMNDSGRAVAQVLSDFQENPENLIVVHDDLDIPLGGIKITARRGPGTHRGLLSIASTLGRNELIRVRIGIGVKEANLPRIDFVLSDFSPEEEEIVTRVIEKAAQGCQDIIILGLEKAMTKWNTEPENKGEEEEWISPRS